MNQEKEETKKKEAVNHPDHYQAGGLECIDVMEKVFGKSATADFCRLNAFKYLWRSDKKNSTIEDMKKARFYIDRYIQIEGELGKLFQDFGMSKDVLNQLGSDAVSQFKVMEKEFKKCMNNPDHLPVDKENDHENNPDNKKIVF